MKAETKQQYLEIAARYLIGHRALTIAENMGLSIRTIRRALAWYASQRLALSTEEHLELAIASKETLKRRAVERLAQLREGWPVVKTTTKNGEVMETTTERMFSPNSEVGLLRTIRDLDNDLSELHGILRHIRTAAPLEDESIDVDISISGVSRDAPYYRNKEEEV